MQKFEIPFRLPGLNEYTDDCRANKYSGGSVKKKATKACRQCAMSIGKIKKPSFFEFEWYERTKKRDKDNVAFAKKFILDGLVKSGRLENDNNQWVMGFSDSFVYGKGQKIIVKIYDCDEIGEKE